VERAALRAGCGPHSARDVVLAIDEACQNVIRHAYCGNPQGEIVVRLEREREKLVCLIRDFAPPVDPDQVRPRDPGDLRPGGLGTLFIRELMDEVEFVSPPAGEGNLLRLCKRID
jgi:sigma-B regulation protein RsbU (phosphoserine phosphatase)